MELSILYYIGQILFFLGSGYYFNYVINKKFGIKTMIFTIVYFTYIFMLFIKPVSETGIIIDNIILFDCCILYWDINIFIAMLIFNYNKRIKFSIFDLLADISIVIGFYMLYEAYMIKYSVWDAVEAFALIYDIKYP